MPGRMLTTYLLKNSLSFSKLAPRLSLVSLAKKRCQLARPLSTSAEVVSDKKINVEDLASWTNQRTSVTRTLWEMRMREVERQNARKQKTEDPNAPSKDSVVTERKTRTPSESAKSIVLPFSSDPALRRQYLSPFGHLRIGRLLEDLDAFAGSIAWSHADPASFPGTQLTIVTAGMDKMDLRSTLYPDRNLRLNGNVTWVGSSSMEVFIEAESQRGPNEWETTFTAFFTMVALTKQGKPISVPKLELVTEMDKQRFAQGEENKKKRLHAAQHSLHLHPPTDSERSLIHSLLMMKRNGTGSIDSTTNSASQIGNPSAAPSESGFPLSSDKTSSEVLLGSTLHESLLLCQPQERNISNKIFGGYLMRKAFELGFCTSHLFAQEQPYFHALDDISFHRPVEIGSMLLLKGAVTFVHDRTMVTEVTAQVLNPAKRDSFLTNRFYFTFKCEKAKKPLPTVLPVTYEEAMRFLEGKRKYERRYGPVVNK